MFVVKHIVFINIKHTKEQEQGKDLVDLQVLVLV